MLSTTTSKGQIIPKDSDCIDDYICKLTLNEYGLIIERDEYLREKECLYDIPLNDIIDIDYLNGKEQKGSAFKSAFLNFVGILALLLSGIGLLHDRPKTPDILKISFYNSNCEIIKLVFNMMEFGEGGLTKKYKKLVH